MSELLLVFQLICYLSFILRLARSSNDDDVPVRLESEPAYFSHPAARNDRYIIELDSSVPVDDFLTTELNNGNDRAEKIVIGEFKGYILTQNNATEAPLEKLSVTARSYVKSVTEEGPVAFDTVPDVASMQLTESSAPWNLARISHRDPNIIAGSNYTYSGDAGSNAFVYVLDTGVDLNHEEFHQNRAQFGSTYVGMSEGTGDTNGHGTNVAGIIAGTKWGVAKKANLISVKVLNHQGVGSWSNVLRALQNITSEHQVNPNIIRIVNLSLTGPRSDAINNAINAAVKEGVHIIAAAGNSGDHACNYSPASAGSAITVGAITSSGQIAPFSNYGVCVDLFAPGTIITSARAGTHAGTVSYSGTSQAAPHVSGTAALILSELNKNYSPSALKKALLAISTKGVIHEPVYNTSDFSPNLIVFNRRERGNWQMPYAKQQKQQLLSHEEL